MPIVAVGASRSGLDRVNLIGDAAGREGAGLGAVAAQFLDDILVVVRSIVAGEAGKGLGQDVVVVYVFQTGFAGDIQPQAMKQLDVLVLHGGRVRSDTEGVDDAVGLHDLQQELPFRFRYGFPGAAQGEGLLGGSHFAGEAADHGGRLEVVGGLSDGRPRVTSWDHEERDPLADTFGHGDGACEQGLLVIAEDLLGGKTVSGGAELADAGGHYNHVLFVRVGALQRPAEVVQRVVVADRDEHVAGADADSFTLDGFCQLQLELLLHLRRIVSVFAPVHSFGEGEDSEEDDGKNQAAHRGHRLGKEIHDRGGEQNHPDRGQSDRDLDPKQVEIGRHFPVTLTLIAVAQNQHGDGFEDEAPDHAEGVGFAESVDVAPTDDDGEELKSHDEVDDAVSCAVLLVRTTEPVGEHAVFRDAIEHSVRTDDGGVYGARQNQESDNHDERAKGQAHNLRADHVHGESGDQVVAVHLHADAVGDQHDRQQ